MQLPLVGSSVAIHIYRHCRLSPVLLCKPNTSANGDMGTHDSVSAVEPLDEHVHRAAFAVRYALLFA